MTLGRCPLSIFCSRGTPPNECQGAFPLATEEGTTYKMLRNCT